MEIAFVTYGCCIRVIKEAIALAERGHKIILITHCDYLPMRRDIFSDVLFYTNYGELQTIISKTKADIFHVHTEPTRIVIDTATSTDIPVVFDCHDAVFLRSHITPEDYKETAQIACEKAAGFIFPSVSLGELMKKTFSINKPCEVVYSKVNKCYVPKRLKKMGGIVYQGGVSAGRRMGHRNFYQLSKMVDLHIYPAGEPETIKNLNYGIIHPTLSYPALLRELTRYDWGLLGNLEPSLLWDISMPHKLFEYLAAGLPVICLNAKEPSRYVLVNKCGISVSNMKDFDLSPEPFIPYVNKTDFLMENEVEKIERLYRKIGSSQ